MLGKGGVSEIFGSKRAQVTIFIIIAVFVVAAVALFFLFRNSIISSNQIPPDFQATYNTFLSCIQENAQTGINVLESQGGYIYLPQFKPGSTYMPFSSQLNFVGNPIPYWFYVSGNNIAQMQVPNKTFMEDQLAQFIDSKIKDCNFGSYANQNFQITLSGTPSSSVTINPSSVSVNLRMDLTIKKGNETATVRTHKVDVNSELGNLFKTAQQVYNYEQTTFFLENYTIDTLRNYAPVDGVNLTCSPQIWNGNTVVSNLKEAIQNNIESIKSGQNTSDYFTMKLPVQGVRFITSQDWPSTYEINPTEGDFLIAKPIGNQPGLGILGFCFVPYHFVYSIKYPVLAVVQSGKEIFQFPMAVIVQGNKARIALNTTSSPPAEVDLCNQGTQKVVVNVFDSNSNPVNANISYECVGETCKVGSTQNGVLDGNFPQCANGYIMVSAPGYNTGKYQFSTTESGSISIALNRVYNMSVDLQLDGKPYNGNAIIIMNSSDGQSNTIIYPQQRSINLSEGEYTVQVYIYENSSVTVASSTQQKCVNVPASGIAGSLGVTTQQCFNINIPSQVISNALAGGGQSEYYAVDSNLQNSNRIVINAPSLPKPTSITQLQSNYVLFQGKTLSINLQ